ncbi:hypothetical protein RTG_01797 [Rhodotorula toruloides ATCC 204091]|uniref:Uncharacterized protein n=1 Tax=Rhodotorula toruloides TaxID=5286 RepID=A0A0K3CN25_RHOTO|nr:hypothetical protein RTG_01797 [Rhodotorula toruloides ATCC 204091]KAK4330089.1 Protein YIP [Rhodotorula toruloides]PRQ71822.1 hypothetical protein AAT19DRAFT_9937 [Rhodotorula toruloides]
MSRPDTLFDVDDSAAGNLSFQNFGSTTIQPDLPSGRISPNASPHVRANEQLYSAEQRIGGTIDGATKSGGVLNLDFYSGWFDVDTMTVLTRCYKTLIPKEDYVSEVLAGVPDLYGPFWVPSTLVFSLFLTSSLWSSINAYLNDVEYAYDFTRLGAATSVVYTYCLGLPVVMWAAIKYWASASERSPVEIISLYGYQSTVWILVAWLTLIPIAPLRLFLAFLGTLLSLFFLTRNLYPILSNAPNVSARLLIVVATVLHLIFAVALWWGFMAGGSGAFDGKKLKDVAGEIGTGIGGGIDGDGMRWKW